jgi:hypothetical protein
MTERIIHNEEGYTLQVEHPAIEPFPARKSLDGAKNDLFDMTVKLWGVDSAQMTVWDKDLEVVENGS